MPNRTVAVVLALAMKLSSAAAFAAVYPEASRASEPQPSAGNSFRSLVHYTDLDLTTASGSDALKDRVRAAATAGCKGIYRNDSLSYHYTRACVRSSYAAAKQQIARAIVLAHAGKRDGTEVAVVGR